MTWARRPMFLIVAFLLVGCGAVGGSASSPPVHSSSTARQSSSGPPSSPLSSSRSASSTRSTASSKSEVPSLGAVSWSSPPAPWVTAVGLSPCAFQPTPLGDQGIAVAVVSNTQCGVAALIKGEWTLQGVPSGSYVTAIEGQDSTQLAMTDGAVVYLYENSSFVTVATAPPGQQAVSLVGLPSGGFAIGTAPIWGCGLGGFCGTTSCPDGLILVAQGGTTRTFPLPKGSVPSHPVECGVSVGAASDDTLWFGVTGVGVAGLDLGTGALRAVPAGASTTYLLPEGGDNSGPVQVLGATSSSVYFSVHRPMGGGRAGYWAGLDAIDLKSGKLQTYLPESPSPCVESGAGAPSSILAIGTRLWVSWPEDAQCPIYTWEPGSSSLLQPASQCASATATTVAVGDANVVEACDVNATVDFVVLNSKTGAVQSSFGLPGSLFAQGLGSSLPSELVTADGKVWFSAHNKTLTILVEVSPAGALLGEYGASAGTVLVAGYGKVWAVGPKGVATIPDS